ncbi:helix-turn-helix domain-containing protein [Arcticibacter svalbardensis]|nr:AraC family transcriptional regulator [Arcticibacter svalbardensis]
MAIIPGLYAIMGLVVLLRYQKSLPDEYSYTETINLNWLKWLVFTILVLFLVLFLFIHFGTQLHLISGNTLFGYVGALLSLYVFLIGYFGLRQSTILMLAITKMTAENVTKDAPYKKSGIDQSAVEHIYLRLLSHMETQKPFLRDDLSLAQLANQLSINSNQLSQVINQKSGSNFFVFVNAYRVEEVKTKLLNPSFSNFSILGIAHDCGFRSKSAFNRIFKEQVGVGPRDYQRKNSTKSSPIV